MITSLHLLMLTLNYIAKHNDQFYLFNFFCTRYITGYNNRPYLWDCLCTNYLARYNNYYLRKCLCMNYIARQNGLKTGTVCARTILLGIIISLVSRTVCARITLLDITQSVPYLEIFMHVLCLTERTALNLGLSVHELSC